MNTQPEVSFQISWDCCLTEVNEKCFVYNSKAAEEEKWTLHFVQGEFFNELASLSLQNAPSRLIFTKSAMFIVDKSSVFVSSISLTPLTLCDILSYVFF